MGSSGRRFRAGRETHGFLDVAGEHVDLEVLRAAVALREGEAVALQEALAAAGAEQHLVDGEGGDLRARRLVHHPDAQPNNRGFHLTTPVTLHLQDSNAKNTAAVSESDSVEEVGILYLTRLCIIIIFFSMG